MRYWAAAYLILAIAAGILGFGGVVANVAGVAKVLFVFFLVVFALALAIGVARQRGNRPRR
jgi:uncharacterized membrane protein YtjA (UPF0391 family)